jgi:hypothetical protein
MNILRIDRAEEGDSSMRFGKNYNSNGIDSPSSSKPIHSRYALPSVFPLLDQRNSADNFNPKQYLSFNGRVGGPTTLPPLKKSPNKKMRENSSSNLIVSTQNYPVMNPLRQSLP